MGIAERVARIQREEREQAEREAQAKCDQKLAEENEKRLKKERARAFAEKIGLGRMIEEVRDSLIGKNTLFQERSRLSGGGSSFCLEWGRGFDSYIFAFVRDSEEICVNGLSVRTADRGSIEEALARAFLNPGSNREDEEDARTEPYEPHMNMTDTN